MLSMVAPMAFLTTLWLPFFFVVYMVFTTVCVVIPMGSRAISCAFYGMSYGLHTISYGFYGVPYERTSGVICYLLYICYSL